MGPVERDTQERHSMWDKRLDFVKIHSVCGEYTEAFQYTINASGPAERDRSQTDLVLH